MGVRMIADALILVPKHPVIDDETGQLLHRRHGKIHPGQEFVWHGDPDRPPSKAHFVEPVIEPAEPTPAAKPARKKATRKKAARKSTSVPGEPTEPGGGVGLPPLPDRLVIEPKSYGDE